MPKPKWNVSETRERDQSLPYSGERHVPGVGGAPTELEHEHRYALAETVVHGMTVLDIGCGEGYGSERLAKAAESVVAIDIDEETVAHARRAHAHERLVFRVADAEKLPFDSGSFDLCIAFELIEHLESPERLLQEAKRVLRPGGRLVLSTPNRDVASDASPEVNPFHRRVFSLEEISGLVSQAFRIDVILGQLVSAASFAWPLSSPSATVLNARGEPAIGDAKYFVIVATSGQEAPRVTLGSTMYPDTALGVIQEREQFWRDAQWADGEIRTLQARIDEGDRRLEEAFASLEGTQTARSYLVGSVRDLDAARAEAERLGRALEGLERSTFATESELARTISEVDSRERELEETHESIAALREELGRLRRNLDRSEQAGSRLQEQLGSVLESKSWRLTRPLRRIRRSQRPEQSGDASQHEA